VTSQRNLVVLSQSPSKSGGWQTFLSIDFAISSSKSESSLGSLSEDSDGMFWSGFWGSGDTLK